MFFSILIMMTNIVTKSTRAVVTGASGHLGFHVAKELLRHGVATTLATRRRNENIDELARLGATVNIVDLHDSARMLSILRGFDVLFHAAAQNTTNTSNPESVLASTVGLAKEVLGAAVDASIPTIVYTSSTVVIGRSPDPQRLLTEKDRATVTESPYVRGKVEAELVCEQLIRDRQADIRRVYPSWVVGPGDPRGTPPHELINRYLRKGQKFWFHGGISIASVEEVARGHVNAWLQGQRCGQYILGGANLTFREFFTMLAEITHQSPPGIFLPKAAIVAAAAVLDIAFKRLGKKPPIDPAYANSVIGSYSWYDSSRAKTEIGYKIAEVTPLLAEAIRLERMRRIGTYSLGRNPPSSQTVTVSSPALPPLLITGVPGWLGNRMVDVLIHGLGSQIAPASRRVNLLVEPGNANLLDLPANFNIFPADLRDFDALCKALAGVGTVIHLAGAIYPRRISTLYEVNVEGARNLVRACIAMGVRRFLYMSTDSVCGHGTPEKRLFDEHTPPAPYRHYGASKYLAEKYVLEQTAAGQIDGTVLRGFWFFGPFAPERQMSFLAMMKKSRQIVFGNGRNLRSISHVDNTIGAFLKIENVLSTIGKWYWVGDAKCDYTVDDIYRIFCEANHHPYRPVYIPGFVCSAMRAVDFLMGKAGRLHPTIHGIGKFDFDIAGSTEAAQRDFGYEPVTSLAEYARSVSQQKDNFQR
jgi:dihydroflavonol-4-reductase